jgi:hypothetical protein
MVPWIVGQGWKFQKMHALTKFVDYMILFGRTINFFGGIGECNHKKFVKDTRCNTQKRINTFTTQYTTRYYGSMIFNMATQCISRRNDCLFGVSKVKARNNRCSVMEGKYVFTFKVLTREGVFHHTVTVRRTDLPDRCVQAIALHATKNEYCENYSVHGYTACKLLLNGSQNIFWAIFSYMDDDH